MILEFQIQILEYINTSARRELRQGIHRSSYENMETSIVGPGYTYTFL